jgi:hypothetical protein
MKTNKEEKQEIQKAIVVQEEKKVGKVPATKPVPAASKTVAPKATAPAAKPATKPVTIASKPAANAKADHACKHDTKKDPVKPAEIAKSVEVPAAVPTPTEISKPASAKDAKEDPPKMNKKISSSRLLLARVYSRLEDIENSKKYYNEVIDAEPNVNNFLISHIKQIMFFLHLRIMMRI